MTLPKGGAEGRFAPWGVCKPARDFAYFTTRKGVIQAFDCKQNAARANFRRAALGYFIFLAFAATAFASAIISRC